MCGDIEKLEKVIKALENCNAPEKCRDCPWKPCEEPDCKHSDYPDGLIEQAIALLKAQEPRVMTLEEAQGADYCWYESRTANICILCDATMYPNLNGKPKTELQTMGTAGRGWQYDYAYGKDWRCWDKEPTNVQREATPWHTT